MDLGRPWFKPSDVDCFDVAKRRAAPSLPGSPERRNGTITCELAEEAPGIHVRGGTSRRRGTSVALPAKYDADPFEPRLYSEQYGGPIMRLAHLAPWLGALLVTAPAGLAQVVYLQNDSFTGGAFTCQTGVADSEAVAVRLTAQPGQYPYTIERVRILGCGGSLNGVILDIYQDTGGVNPGPLIWHGTLYTFDGSNVFNDILMSNEPIPPPPIASGSVRVVLTAFVVLPPIGFGADTNGITPVHNFLRSAGGVWSFAENAGVSGDWIVRLGILPNTPVELQSFDIE